MKPASFPAASLAAMVTVTGVLRAAEPATVVFANGTESHHTWRIPAVVAARDGTLLAFAEGRVAGPQDSGDIDLVLKRSSDGGRTWSAARTVWDDGGNSCSNPCPVVISATGEVLLLAVWKPGKPGEKEILKGNCPPENKPRPVLLRSVDAGLTWSAPQDLPATASRPEWQWYVTGPGNGIELRTGPHPGRLVVPANHSQLVDGVSVYDAPEIKNLAAALGASIIAESAQSPACCIWVARTLMTRPKQEPGYVMVKEEFSAEIYLSDLKAASLLSDRLKSMKGKIPAGLMTNYAVIQSVPADSKDKAEPGKS